jgi:glutamine synthetase/predicted TIM-barrel fold metal-dependent hydrolase
MAISLEQAHETIYDACLKVPLVDAHAHNIVALDSNLPFLQCLSDERGHEALSGVPFSLAYQRSLQELGAMYGVDANEASLKAHRETLGLEAVSEKCFGGANIECVLLDDGLTMDRMLGMGWHRKYVPSVHRVLRIETVAEAVLNQPVSQGGFATWTLESFDHRFVSTLESLSEKVVAFKSICAYRSGLRINPLVSAQAAETGLHENLQNHQAGQPVLVSNKAFIDFMFVRALEVATQRNIPMQIHTGFGDKDLQLELANPLHLRAILEDPLFAKSRIVLLHGSYPFMREASYLASVYSQVHIDFGLVVPMLSVRGMRCALSDLLDLAPVNKIMFSSDGYAFPETFYLGAKWSREMLTRVLCESYDNGDLTLEEAVAAAGLILNRNAIDFYKLEGNQPPPLPRALSTESLMRLHESLVPTNVEKPPSFEFRVSPPVPKPAHPNGSTPGHYHDANPTPRFGKAQELISKPEPLVPVTPVAPVVERPPEVVAVEAVEPVDVKPVEVTLVRLTFVDVSGQIRCRIIPTRRFEEVVVQYGVGIAQCIMAMSSHTDCPAPDTGFSPVGEIRLMPDLSTKVILPWAPDTVVVYANMHEKPGVPWKYCPRNTLQRLSQTLRMSYNLVMRAGFDVGFYLLKQAPGSQKWELLNSSSFSSAAGVHAASLILDEIYDVLKSFNIDVEEMHCEGGGQYVVSIKEVHVLSAADNFLLVKETVSAIADKHSLRASFLPNLHPSSEFGSSRVRLSLWQEDRNALGAQDAAEDEYGLSPFGQCFLGGIYHHLPAILAFTAPLPVCYGSTSDSVYHFWGQGNLQAPVRTLSEGSSTVSSLELRQFDGCSNPHLGLAAILASGIDGLRKHIHAPKPLDTDVAELDPETVARLPAKLEEAVAALESNKVMRETIGSALVTAVVGVRKAEVLHYKGHPEMKELLIAENRY